MKREIDITMLMDNYTDNEFNIGGEAGVEAEKVVSAVLPQVKQRKKAKPLFKVIAAAAAAVVALATVMAATVIRGGRFTTINGGGGTYEFYPNGGASASFDLGEDVLVKEDDRLYFVIGDEKTDVTDIIDPQTPYIYSYNVESNSQPIHIIIGGTAEHYSFVHLAYFEGIGWWGMGKTDSEWAKEIMVQTDDDPVLDADGNILHEHGWSFHWDGYEDANGNGEYDREEKTYRYGYNNDFIAHVDIPPNWREVSSMVWLIDALDQLGLIEVPDPNAPIVTTAATEKPEETESIGEGYAQTEPCLPEPIG
ncbi:MAG: hypothetical protein J1F60_05305 [Oscillospiraceae bacterium]|nr:hypothetical protein [Oscillospiraceae bacterium]